MPGKKILLLYISEHSGHHCASLAIEDALRKTDSSVNIVNINSLHYTNPILEKIINKTYMSVVKRTPEVWEYLYDNPGVVRHTQRLREMIHRFNTGKLKTMMDEFSPDVVVCTQAFPCGMVADYKKSFSLDLPIVAVLTDYAPHSYWVYNNIDKYVVPSDETGRKLIDDGIDPSRIAVFGIPINKRFAHKTDRGKAAENLGFRKNAPIVLVMGGTQGLGPIKEVVWLLDNTGLDLQLAVVTGTNRKLFRWLNARKRRFKNPVRIFQYVHNIDELMDLSSIIITKPGGITTAEALAKGLPMLIFHPLPGQEAMNTRYLLKEGAAVKAENPADVVVLLKELLYNEDKLKIMSDRARSISKPSSAVDIAKLIIQLTERR